MIDVFIEVLTGTIAAMLSLLMLTTSIGKIVTWPEFAGIITAYRLLPSATVTSAAAGLIAAEIASGIGLILGLSWAFAFTAALLAVFGVAMSIKLLQGEADMDCGCEPGQRGSEISWSLVVRNIFLAALAIFCFSRNERPQLNIWLIGIATGLPLFLIQLASSALRTRPRPLSR